MTELRRGELTPTTYHFDAHIESTCAGNSVEILEAVCVINIVDEPGDFLISGFA